MNSVDSEKYFDFRANRYANAICKLKNARVIDVIPYLSVLKMMATQNPDDLYILDAFGGTGFLSNSIRHKKLKFVVADCSEKMLSNLVVSNNVTKLHTNSEFSNLPSDFEKKFDAIFTHGGFHHVIADKNHNGLSSFDLQLLVLSNLIKCIKNNGIMIIADIPQKKCNNVLDGIVSEKILDKIFVEDLLGKEMSDYLFLSVIPSFASKSFSINDIDEIMINDFFSKVDYDVPRYFFDKYVAEKTQIGHSASYLDFDLVDGFFKENSFTSIGRINFHSPWIFRSKNDAGWYFREKFSIGKPYEKGEKPLNELRMFSVLKKYLGVNDSTLLTSINWGVTYAIYKKK